MITLFDFLVVPVITFAWLIVVSHQTDTGSAIKRLYLNEWADPRTGSGTNHSVSSDIVPSS